MNLTPSFKVELNLPLKECMKKIVLSTIILALTACTGGGDNKSPNQPQSPPNSGVFVDSLVGGVYFKTETQSGMTDDNGRFSCRTAEVVDFFLKGDNGKEVSLGSVPCRAVVSPIDVVTSGRLSITSNINTDLTVDQKDRVVKMLRLLQSLDSDGNPSNGITMRPSDVTKLSNVLEARGQTSVEAMFSGVAYEEDLSVTMAQIGRSVVTEAQATAHFESTQELCSDTLCQAPPQVGGGDPTPTPVQTPNPTPTPGPGGGDPTPVPTPISTPTPTPGPSYVACMNGVTYANKIVDVTGGTIYPVNTSNGTVTDSTALTLETRIFFKSNGDVELYRQRSGYAYYKFQVEAGAVVSESINIYGIGFSNGLFNLSFGPEQMMGYSKVRYATQNSVGSTMTESRRMWIYDTANCQNQVPNEVIEVTPGSNPTPAPSATPMATPTPVPVANIVKCISGSLPAQMQSVSGQYQALPTYIINQADGSFNPSNQFATDRMPFTMILKSDGSAKVYRQRNGQVWHEFQGATWIENGGVLTVINIGFQNRKASVSMDAEYAFYGSTVRDGQVNSFGQGDPLYRRMSVTETCVVPAQPADTILVTPPNN